LAAVDFVGPGPEAALSLTELWPCREPDLNNVAPMQAER